MGSDTVKGTADSPPYSYALNGLSTAGTAIVSSAAMDGGDGGWPVLYGTSPLTPNLLQLAIQEDQMKDSERRHTTEQVAFFVLEEPEQRDDTAPPTVSINNPSQGDEVNGIVTISADAFDDIEGIRTEPVRMKPLAT